MWKELSEYVIRYKLQKADTAIKEAILLHENDMNETAVSRLYFAAFYAANALLESEGIYSKTHIETKSFLIKEYFSIGKLDKVYADLYTMLMSKRHNVDYEDFAHSSSFQLPDFFKQTKQFVNAVKSLISFE